jgi:hypothetical protein
LITLTDTVGSVSTYSITVPVVILAYDLRNDRTAFGRVAGAAKTLWLPDDWYTNIVSTRISNPNLLHNWDFRFTPVNQRAASGDITSGYFYDRWFRYAGTITIAATYLSLPDTVAIEQRIEGNALSGKVVMVSVMIGDAVISGTGTFPTSAGHVHVTIAGFGDVELGYATGYMYARFTAATSTRQVQAVKLELCTVSTLAYDPPMEYGVELAKCQRYFISLGAQYMGYGATSGTTGVDLWFSLPCPMRITTPTLTASGATHYCFSGAGAKAFTVTSSSLKQNTLNIIGETTGLTGANALAGFLASSTLITLSADL